VRARRTTLLAIVVLPLALTGCGVGLDPQTYRERTSQDASNISLGDLALRNVAIAPPDAGAAEFARGADAQLTLAVVSTSGDPDTLVAVSTPAATAAGFVDASGHAVPSVSIPANGTAGYGDFGVVLRGLTRPLRPGMYVDMTFRFQQHLGKVTVAHAVVQHQDHGPVSASGHRPM